ncbi:MAG TPA: precorrin-2 C(20)-methyltransferase [Candidatus Dormibacteraeota bacterium]|nr:precorrin-2 C(20)-methyltransferase [Candidatus Dormibacteraeota bacterium]
MKNGKVVGVGVGPGDPDLLTLKAIRVLQDANVVCAPTPNSAGHSVALDIVKQVLQGRESAPEVITLIFPMIRDEAELERVWSGNTDRIAKYAHEGKLVAYVSIGDPSLYSTFTYIHRQLSIKYPDITVEIIPGVTSLSACVAKAGVPLASGDETLLIMPKFDLELLKEESRLVDNIVLMKGVRNLPETIKLLTDSSRFSDKTQILIAKRCSFPDEELWKGDMHDALQLKLREDYFATIIVRRKPSDG